MSNPYQDPRYQATSGSYQNRTSPNPPRQSELPSQHYPTHDGYPAHQSQQGQPTYLTPTYSDGRQQPQTSVHSGYSPHAEHIPIPVPYADSDAISRQRSSTGYSSSYGAPSTSPHSPAGIYQQGHQEAYGYPSSAGGGSSSGQRPYPASGSVASSADLYARSGVQNQVPSYTSTNSQVGSQEWNDPEYDEGEFRPKGPPAGGASGTRPKCRISSCNNYVFFDRRVNELREWCSDEHMQAALIYKVEKPCKQCGRWPRRYGGRYCSADGCRYQPPPPQSYPQSYQHGYQQYK